LAGSHWGTKAEKAVRIQLVISSIIIAVLSLRIPRSALPTIVEMLQFLKPVGGRGEFHAKTPRGKDAKKK
jgi:hypothetical protein